jgi:fructose-1-phosphate kinase PfkB-like protein
MLTVGAKATPFAIKVNAKEISELAGQQVHERAEALEISRSLRKAYAIPLISVTLGPKGSVCSSDWGDWIVHPVQYPEVISSIGSGDSFLGGLLVQYEHVPDGMLRASLAEPPPTHSNWGRVFSIEDYTHALEDCSGMPPYNPPHLLYSFR